MFLNILLANVLGQVGEGSRWCEADFAYRAKQKLNKLVIMENLGNFLIVHGGVVVRNRPRRALGC
jgi:hypothetical protein